MTKEEHNMDLNSEKIKIWHFVGPKINCFSISFEWFGVKKIFQNKHVDFSQKVATVIYSTIFSILKHCAYGRRYIAVYIIDSYNLWCLVWKTNASGSVFSKKLITSWLHLLWEIWKVVSFICLVDGYFSVFKTVQMSNRI